MHKYNEYLSRNEVLFKLGEFLCHIVINNRTIQGSLYAPPFFYLLYYLSPTILQLFQSFPHSSWWLAWCLWFYIWEMPFSALLCPSQGILLKSKSDRTWLSLLPLSFPSIFTSVTWTNAFPILLHFSVRKNSFFSFHISALFSKIKLEKKIKEEERRKHI